MEMPVYLFTGFLEAGKTKMIVDTLLDENFNTGEKFLVIACEEGIEEYDASAFRRGNVAVEYIENEADFNAKNLSALEKKHKPERIMIEYNGMWMLNTLYRQMPEGWMVYQEMMFADANTFLSYNSNMRQLVVDKLTTCEMVIFNRAKNDVDKEEFHKIVRTVNPRATIAYETVDGEFVYDDIEDPLPFDIDADIIDIEDKHFAIWYRDMSEDPEKYEGKTVRFNGICAKEATFPKGKFAVGRHVMTCCVEDITYCGIICKWKDAEKIKTKNWVTVTARFNFEYDPLYEGKGPLLTAVSVEKAKAPEQQVATFY